MDEHFHSIELERGDGMQRERKYKRKYKQKKKKKIAQIENDEKN